MKAWEICKEENVDCKYKDSNGQEWKVKKLVFNSTYYDLQDRYGEPISKKYYLSTIAELDFEEIIDWSKVAVDTKILVANFANIDDGVIKWNKRHFAKYENGEVYAWMDGRTSFTTEHNINCEFAKLYEEGVDE